MMTFQEAKDNLLKDIITPNGVMTLYGINCIPNFPNSIGLIFYKDNKRIYFYVIDCNILDKDILKLGLDVFGTDDKFRLWMNTKVVALGNVTPYSLLSNTSGKDLVINELIRINNGILS